MTDSPPQATLGEKCASSSDVFIAGAGPAGLACAIASAQLGLSVEMADGNSPPIDKACGEGLLPETVSLLTSLGIPPERLSPDASHPLLGIRFIGPPRSSGPGRRAEALFSSRAGLGLERKTLHQTLLERACALGVRIHWKTVVSSMESPAGRAEVAIRTNRSLHRSRFLIGADGHASRIRSLSGLDSGRVSSRRFGLRQHFLMAPWSSLVEVYWSDRGEAYVTPVADNKICVAFLAHQRFSSVHDALSHFPELRSRLCLAPPADSPRGAISVARRLDRVRAGNVALLGDASGSVDAITGQGLSLAFRQAQALAEACRSGYLHGYQARHRAIMRMPALMSRSMLLMDRYPFVRNATIRSFASVPALFYTLLEVHTEPEASLKSVAAS